MMKHYQIVLKGNLKGKGYRFHSYLAAKHFEITGSVKESDNFIQILAEGTEQNLQCFIDWCSRGLAGCKPEAVEISERKQAYYRDFSIL